MKPCLSSSPFWLQARVVVTGYLKLIPSPRCWAAGPSYFPSSSYLDSGTTSNPLLLRFQLPLKGQLPSGKFCTRLDDVTLLYSWLSCSLKSWAIGLVKIDTGIGYLPDTPYPRAPRGSLTLCALQELVSGQSGLCWGRCPPPRCPQPNPCQPANMLPYMQGGIEVVDSIKVVN